VDVTKVATLSADLDATQLTAVLPPFIRGLPCDGRESALEEGIVDDVVFLVFAFDNPVAGIGFARASVGEDGRDSSALRSVYEKWSAGAKGVHFSSPGGVVMPTELCFHRAHKKTVTVWRVREMRKIQKVRKIN
jgi:hypothetical protein